MIRLNLRQNALHTLYHAVEHLYWSQGEPGSKEGRSLDLEQQSVEWRSDHGNLSFRIVEFTRLPPVYGLKFAILHLIQGAELLLKAYIQGCEPTALFVRAGSRRTIDLRTALEFAVGREPMLLSPEQYALLLEAKEIRNRLEHYEFCDEECRLRVVCIEFLAICLLLAQALLSVNLVEAFSWDHLREAPDEVGDFLSSIMNRASDMGRQAARRSGELWASANALRPVFLCLNCGARAVARDTGVCMGCGAEGDEDLVTLLGDFELAVRRISALQRLVGLSDVKG